MSEMFVAHKEVTNGATTKVLVCVIIRGTNGTIQEWQSNFDVGTTDNYGSTTGWTSSTNHMGFDITANRLDAWLTNYLIDNGILTANKAFWITGHSRGGALANLLAAKRVDAGYEVYAYTFASPNTTTKGGANSDAKYQCIFNVINTDDLVPQLPMEAWGFKRFGVDVAGSIEEDYADDWDALMSGEFNYTSGITAVNRTVEAFENIADNRNQCYEYRSGITAYYVDLLYSSTDAAALAAMDVIADYPDNTAGTYSWVPTSSAELYGYAMYQQPAFLMQLLAAYMGERIDKTEFVTTRVAGYLGAAKERLIVCAGLNLQFTSKIEHPHYTESYYLLATELNG